MVYITETIKSTGTSMPYVPTPLDLPMKQRTEEIINTDDTKKPMTKEQQEEDFIKN